ncbi:hypothetical protein AK88_01973 [Plasmodium fragile]|uniref:Uncharacterized protein n=1 Tax=Plasmodium fragile TaxID=5857 RepID=A0A0D9QNH8_PLAFR|nr:uncharacterized protein AK88_01973 [Plasmodium fragile]KJP88357.1 hypothetical protein AK88_01973 [Plasmodium fragile]
MSNNVIKLSEHDLLIPPSEKQSPRTVLVIASTNILTMISDEDSPFLIENIQSILKRGNTKVVHDKRKKYVDDVFDLALSNLRSGMRKIGTSQEIDINTVSTRVQNREHYLESESLTLSNEFSSDVGSTTQESEGHNECAFCYNDNYDSENFDDEEHFECSPGFRNHEDIRVFNENVKRKFFNDLVDYYNIQKLEQFDENYNCGQSAYSCEDFELSQNHSGCENTPTCASPSFEKNVLDNSPVGAKHVAAGWGSQIKHLKHSVGGKTQHSLLTSDKKCMQRTGASKHNTDGRVTPQPIPANGMIKTKQEIIDNTFITLLEEKSTATHDKQFATLLPNCGGIEPDSEGGERKSTHKGNNKRNVHREKTKRGKKGLERCNDLTNGTIEAAPFQPTDDDKSKCTNGGDFTKCPAKIWCSEKCANVPKLDLELALTLPNRAEDLRDIIDKGGVAMNGNVYRKKTGRRINTNKNHNHLGRDASELSRFTLSCDEKRSNVILQISGSSRLDHSSLNEKRKKGNISPHEPELDSSETNTLLSVERKKDSKLIRKRICKSSIIHSPRERLSRNQQSSENIAHERETSDSSNGIEKRRTFIEHSRRKTVYNGEERKKRLRKNEAKLKKGTTDSFDTGKGQNLTHEKKKVDSEKWENKSNSGRFEGDSVEGEILQKNKTNGKLSLLKRSEQYLCYVKSRGKKIKTGEYKGVQISSVESSKCNTVESSKSTDLRSNYEGHRGHARKKNDEEVLEERPLEMFRLSKKRLHFCKGEGDEEKLKLYAKHPSDEKVVYDQKGEYFFSDKCREIHTNMADENLNNGISPDMMYKTLLGGEADNQYARKGEDSKEDYSYEALEEVSKNGAHNFYCRKSRYTILGGNNIRLSGVGDGGEQNSRADLSNSVRSSSRIDYFSGGEHYSGFGEVEEHCDGQNDDKYHFPFCDEMYEDGKFAEEVDLPRGDSVLGSGKDDLYLAFQESTPRGYKSLPEELLHRKLPPSNVQSELKDETHLRRREYVQGQICRILKKENWDGEAESMLNLFFRYVKVEGRCGKNGNTLIRKDIKRDRKGGSGRRGNKMGVRKQKQQNSDLGREENGGVDKLKRVYLDDAPRSLPLTMLIVRNYEEGNFHHPHQQQRMDRNDGGAKEKVSVRYKVELTGVRNPMGIKKAVGKEKKLFSRIERIYDFCALDGDACGEQCHNNLMDRFIPFPNMGWSCSKESYQHDVINVHSAWAQERERVLFYDERENLNNVHRSQMGEKDLMLDGALLKIPQKEGTNEATKFENRSPFAKWNVNMCTKSIKQPAGKNALVTKGPKGVAIHLDRKGALKYSFRKGVPIVGARGEGRALRIGSFKKSPLSAKSALEGSYPKRTEVTLGRGHHVTNFKEYLIEMRKTREGNKTEEPLPKDGQKREELRHAQGVSPLSSSILKMVDDKKEDKIITNSFLPPTGVEAEVVKAEIWDRPKGEVGSYRQLKSSSGHVFKRGGSEGHEDVKLLSEPLRDVLDPLSSAHNGSQNCQHDPVETKETVTFYKSNIIRGTKGHKEGDGKGAAKTCEDSHAGKNNRDGDHPRRSFNTDKQSSKAIENGAQGLDGNSSGKSPRSVEKPSSNERKETTKTLHAEGTSKNGLSPPSKDGKRKQEGDGSNNSRSERLVEKFHPSVIERFYESAKRSKVGKDEAAESGLEQEADTLNKEGSPRKIHMSIEVASPRKNSHRRKGSLKGGKSISHFVSKHGKGEKKQDCAVDPSTENKISRGRDDKAKTAKGFSKKSEFYNFTNWGENVEENISSLMVEEEGDILTSDEGRSPSCVSNTNEISLTVSPHGRDHTFNAPKTEGNHEGNNGQRTTNLVKRRKSNRVGRRGGKASPRAMGSFPHKMTQSEMDKPVLKNEKAMARNSNYVDLRHIECSKSTLEFLLEKKYLKRNSAGEGTDGTEGQKKKKEKRKKDLSLVCNKSEGRELSKRFTMSRRKNEKKMSNRKIANRDEVPATDQFSNLSNTEGGKKGPSVRWPRKLFIEEGRKKKEEKKVCPPPSVSSSGAPSSRRSGTRTAATPVANLTRGAQKKEALNFAQIKSAHTSRMLRLNEKTEATPFENHLLTHKKDETKLKRPSHVHSNESSLSYRLANVVRIKRKIYLSDIDVEHSPGMDSRGREDAGTSCTGQEEETQSERGVGEQIGRTGDHKSDQPTGPQIDNHEHGGKIATTLSKATAKKAKHTDHLLTIKVNIITVFLHSSYVKRINMNVGYNIQVTIYSSSDRKTIEKNCRKETFPCYFTSHTSGIGLSSDAFKKIDAMCESESRQFFKLVVSCRRERSFLKKELIRIYSRIFEAPIELKTYSLSKNKKYASETGSSNDDLYEMNGNIIMGTL